MKDERGLPIPSATPFQLDSTFTPRGDQPKAIETLHANLIASESFQTLLGVTGSGKTFTVANVIARENRPTLIIAPNKTLAAQLYGEFKDFFPHDRVHYFVSYYDYYQPEAYIPSSDTYIEKDASINEEIDKMRHAATRALLEQRNTIIVASVSCIYGLGAPEDYFRMMLYVERGEEISREVLLKKLVHMQYQRSDDNFSRGTFRVRGEVIDIFPADEDARAIRLVYFGDEIEEIKEIDSISGKAVRNLDRTAVYPVSHFVTDRSTVLDSIKAIKKELKRHLELLRKHDKTLEAQRLEQRTLYDCELMQEVGFCPGIENYSRHLTGRKTGEPPTTLIDYFPEDFLLVIDESHVTVPQIRGMYRGDQARKSTLVEFGFRLPSALDNRPLNETEFWERVGQTIFASATPGDFELERSESRIIEQVNRPTGLLDPEVIVRPATNQVDDLLEEIKQTVDKNERVLALTLTKRMAEDLSGYLREIGVNARYIHADINTVERVEILRGLRKGDFDVLIGINLLREGLDLVEVSLVAILDADKEGFLRSTRSLIQIMGRAARNINGRVILYADVVTKSMKEAISETDRRRTIQSAFNRKHNITPVSARSEIPASLSNEADADITEAIEALGRMIDIPQDAKDQKKLIEELKSEMLAAAKRQEFEQAAELRDTINAIQTKILERG